ncbi:MAG TPA: fibronectin type III domain-containing protein [Egibacteraceae bacterium]|nr:fibronectin type III domain-containing protein [Egibacteraceae bacterium]
MRLWFVVLLAVVVGEWPGIAHAADIQKPVVLALTTSPSAVDVTGQSAQVTVTGRFTDDVAVAGGYMYFRHPAYAGTRDTALAYFHHVDGTVQDGLWQATVTIPADWPAGEYYSVTAISDTSRNEVVNGRTTYVTVSAPPSRPRSVAASRGDSQAGVSWDVPLSDGGSAITGYTVTSSPGGHTATVGGAARSATVSGLSNGTSYTFTVRATNAVGSGAASEPSNAVTPAGVPGATRHVVAARGDASAMVSWEVPLSDGGSAITGYTVTAFPGGQTASVGGAAHSATVPGLTNGTSYTFTVRAANDVGLGAVSAKSNAVVPSDDLEAPQLQVAAPASSLTNASSRQFSFAAEDPSGPVVTECSLNGAPFTGCTSPVTVSGLAEGEHIWVVRARDAVGNETEPWSTVWTVDTTAPTGGMVQPSTRFTLANRVRVAWSATDAISGVSGSDIRWQRAGPRGAWSAWASPAAWRNTAGSAVTLTGAARGYTYCFQVRTRDKASNVSRWSASRCTSVALDDRDLAASRGWARATGAGYYARTVVKTSQRAATLTAPRATLSDASLVATRCSGCGRVQVLLDGKVIKKVSLHAARTQRKAIIPVLRERRARTGVLSLRVASTGKPIEIDGLATAR